MRNESLSGSTATNGTSGNCMAMSSMMSRWLPAYLVSDDDHAGSAHHLLAPFFQELRNLTSWNSSWLARAVRICS